MLSNVAIMSFKRLTMRPWWCREYSLAVFCSVEQLVIFKKAYKACKKMAPILRWWYLHIISINNAAFGVEIFSMVRSTIRIRQHWCRWWLVTCSGTNRYLKHMWSILLKHKCVIWNCKDIYKVLVSPPDNVLHMLTHSQLRDVSAISKKPFPSSVYQT